MLFRKSSMRSHFIKFVLALSCMAAGAVGVFAQDAGNQQTSQQPSGQQPSEPSGPPPAATGLDTSTQLTENPPLSGLDEPSFEPGYGARSYLVPSAQLSEALDSNATGDVSSANLRAQTRALGSIELQKLWKTHPLDVDYIGGIDWYNGANSNVFQVHSLAAVQRFLWRTGQFAVRDYFSYLPEGTFGFGSFGGVGGFNPGGSSAGLGGGVAGGGGGGLFTVGGFGAFGFEPRITNAAIADVTQYLSPRSSVVVAGGFENTDFLKNTQGLLNGNAELVQVGYNYQLSRKDQVGLLYAFQEVHFPTSGSAVLKCLSNSGTLETCPSPNVNVNVWQLMYGHRISGRMNFLVAGGPQLVHLHETQVFLIFPVPVNDRFITTSARATLTYRFSARTEARLSYLHYINTGSGLFAGAKTDAGTLGVTHTLGRRWSALAQGGYTRNVRLTNAQAGATNSAHSYQYWFAGAGLRRQLDPRFAVFASYQFNSFGFDQGFCTATNTTCSRSYGRQIGAIGVTWTPHPIRLD